jgi:phosphate transport system permease protein
MIIRKNKNKRNNPFYDPSLNKRHASERRFKSFTLSSLIISIAFLAFFLFDIVIKGLPAFSVAYIQVNVTYNEQTIRDSRKAVPEEYKRILSRAWLRNIPKLVEHNPNLMNTTKMQWVLADDQVDQYIKGHQYKLQRKDRHLVDSLTSENKIDMKFNSIFFTNGDSRSAEYAGLNSALMGSILTLIITMIIAFPIGVMTAIYLEEFTIDNTFTRFIEININNLAAIPSILFGLLGLSIFINLFGLPRSSPLVGGLTLALMTLPIIIVSSRASLRAVPDSIRQAAYGLGLNKIQVTKDHVLPLALPGVLTGSIIGLAQAMGETAPLIIIGMIAFIPDAPNTITDAATVLPAQLFTWAGMPEKIYIEKTAAGIMVLLSVIISLNAIAIYLRKKFEVKW